MSKTITTTVNLIYIVGFLSLLSFTMVTIINQM